MGNRPENDITQFQDDVCCSWQRDDIESPPVVVVAMGNETSRDVYDDDGAVR